MIIDKYTENLFFQKVGIYDGDNCWDWLGSIRTKTKKDWPYGILQTPYTYYAHRLSYMIHNGEIPKDKIVRHTCDNCSCVNPKHLILGTPKENTADMLSRNRQAKGETHGRRKITLQDAIDIYNSDLSTIKLSKIYNISDTQIERIKNKTRWAYSLDNQGSLR